VYAEIHHDAVRSGVVPWFATFATNVINPAAAAENAAAKYPNGFVTKSTAAVTAPTAAWVAWHNQFNASPASHCVVTCDAGSAATPGGVCVTVDQSNRVSGRASNPAFTCGLIHDDHASSGIAGFVSPVTIVAIRCTTDFNPGDNAAYEAPPRSPATESESCVDQAGTLPVLAKAFADHSCTR